MSIRQLLLASVVALAVTPAWAQQPPGSESAELTGASDFAIETIRVQSLVELAGYTEVKKELGVIAAAADELTKLRKDHARELATAGRQLGPRRTELRKLSREERAAKLAEAMSTFETAVTKLNEDFDSKLTGILSTDQRARLVQIFVQVAPIDALANATVATKLGLTEAQRKQVNEVRVAWNKVWQTTLSEAYRGPHFVAGTTRVRELNNAMLSKATDVLTTEQKEMLAELRESKPFDKSRLATE